MNNKIENSTTDISAQTQLTNQPKCAKKQKSQEKQQQFLQRIIAVSFAVQAILIGVRGNLDVLSRKSPLDVIPSMLAQGVELILKAQRVKKSIEESDSEAPQRKRCDSERASADRKPRSTNKSTGNES